MIPSKKKQKLQVSLPSDLCPVCLQTRLLFRKISTPDGGDPQPRITTTPPAAKQTCPPATVNRSKLLDTKRHRSREKLYTLTQQSHQPTQVVSHHPRMKNQWQTAIRLGIGREARGGGGGGGWGEVVGGGSVGEDGGDALTQPESPLCLCSLACCSRPGG